MNLRALLELMRVSNLPTVWSNVACGYFIWLALSLSGLRDTSIFEFDLFDSLAHMQKWVLLHPLAMISGVSLIYCGGMVLNDYWDRDIDAKERPGRPIPSGRVKASTASDLAFALLFLGFMLAGGWLALMSIFSAVKMRQLHLRWFLELSPHFLALAALILCVVLYNRAHHAKAASVVLMAACRALAFLVPVTFAIRQFNHDVFTYVFILGPAITLFAYTLLISIVARREMQAKRLAGPRTVMNMIAAMPLLDALWLVLLGLWPASLVCVGCAVLTKLGHRRIAGS